MAPPMERDDREIWEREELGRGWERHGDIETEIKRGRGRQRGPRGTGTGTQYVRGGASRHMGLQGEGGQDRKVAVNRVGPDRGRRRAEKRGTDMWPALSLGEVRRDKRGTQAAATGPV